MKSERMGVLIAAGCVEALWLAFLAASWTTPIQGGVGARLIATFVLVTFMAGTWLFAAMVLSDS